MELSARGGAHAGATMGPVLGVVHLKDNAVDVGGCDLAIIRLWRGEWERGLTGKDIT